MKTFEEEPFDAGKAGGGDLLPRWMVVLYVALLVWGAWYLVSYWRALAGTDL